MNYSDLSKQLENHQLQGLLPHITKWAQSEIGIKSREVLEMIVAEWWTQMPERPRRDYSSWDLLKVVYDRYKQEGGK